MSIFRHERASDQADEASGRRAPGSQPSAGADRILDLQRSAGNAAVTRMLARAPSSPRVTELEYEEGEQIEVARPKEPAAPANAPEPQPSELEEVAAAMGLQPDDPRVKEKVGSIKVTAMFKEQAKKAEEQRAKEAAAAQAEAAKRGPAPDPNDPHQWKQAPGESIEAFLERQRKGLLQKELERTGLTEEQLRKQVMTVGTREESRVSLGKGITGVMITEAVPTPGGGIRVIKTIEIHKKDTIKRSKSVHDFKTGESAFVRSIVEGGKEQILNQSGDQGLFSKPLAEPPKPPTTKVTPHTKWTKLPNGQVKVEYVDEDGKVIPGRGFKTDVFMSPQERREAGR